MPAAAAPGSAGYQGSRSWYQQVAIEIQQFISTITSLTLTTLTMLGNIVLGANAITTTDYTIAQSLSGATNTIKIEPTANNRDSWLQLMPQGAAQYGELTLYSSDTATFGLIDQYVTQTGAGVTEADVDVRDTTGTNVTLNFNIQAKTFALKQDGSLTLPGTIVNTAIADPAAAAGQLWLSSTNVDNLKYSSATTLYTIHSTKGTTNNATSAAPVGTTSATSVMMAVGGAITPANTGRVLITMSGQMANDTLNDGATVDLRYGTGTAPINGAAVTGTLVGIAQTHSSLVAADTAGFCISGIVTGLTLGTAIWVDASLKRVTGGTATLTGVTISVVEI